MAGPNPVHDGGAAEHVEDSAGGDGRPDDGGDDGSVEDARDPGADRGGARAPWARGAGIAGGVAGVAASLFVLFGPVVRYTSESSTGEVTTGTLSGVDYLFGDPNAQFALLAWPLLVGAVSVVGAWAAWSRRGAWLWAAALTLAAFSVVGMMTIGGLYLPGALLLVAGAVLTGATGDG